MPRCLSRPSSADRAGALVTQECRNARAEPNKHARPGYALSQSVFPRSKSLFFAILSVRHDLEARALLFIHYRLIKLRSSPLRVRVPSHFASDYTTTRSLHTRVFSR